MNRLVSFFLVLVFFLAGCSGSPALPPIDIVPTSSAASFQVTTTPVVVFTLTSTPIQPTATPNTTSTFTLTPTPSIVTFAVIGDYGLDGTAEADVAALVLGWEPDLIITTGDNNYPNGAAESMDVNLGKYYHSYISPYLGTFGAGAAQNRFFPALGNHDWYTADARPYLDYFNLPGNERYYDFVWGPLHFFALDSDEHEPDGVNAGSTQAMWLKEKLAASTAAWNIVYMHYPPYSSGTEGAIDWMRWPFAAWGADVVLAGHDHYYERLQVDGIPYFINGAGGGGLYNFGETASQSQFRYNANFGAMRVTATNEQMLFEFYNRVGTLIDSSQVLKP